MSSTLSKLLLTSPPKETGATAIYPQSPTLKRRFTVATRFGEQYPLYRIDGNWIHLPRAVCPVGPCDMRDEGTPVAFDCIIEPRDEEQARVFEEVAGFLLEGLSGQVQAQTGFGKTPLALHSIARVGRKALIVVTKEDLLSYWVAEARKFLKLTDDEVGVIQQDKCQVVGKKVVVALIHSLSIEDRYPKEITEGIGLVIFDESQRLGAEQFSVVASMFPAKLRLALSATPDRADGKELLVQAHIGPIRARGMVEQRVPRVIRLESSWRCPRIPRRDKDTGLVQLVPLPHGNGRTGAVLKSLIKDDERNQMLAELVWIGWEKNRHVVFFSDSIDHLNTIIRLVKAMGIDGEEIGKFVGGLTEKAREEAKSKRLVFTTYAMCAEGVNVPRWDYGIQGTPRSSVTQAVGRIRRACENKPTPIWMDVIDRDSQVFNSYSAKRLTWYRNIGCPVEDR